MLNACTGSFGLTCVAVGHVIRTTNRYKKVRARTHAAGTFGKSCQPRTFRIARVRVRLAVRSADRYVDFRATIGVAYTATLHGDPLELGLAAIAIAAGVDAANRLVNLRAAIVTHAGARTGDTDTRLGREAGVRVSRAIGTADQFAFVVTFQPFQRLGRADSGSRDLNLPGLGEAGVRIGIAIDTTHRLEGFRAGIEGRFRFFGALAEIQNLDAGLASDAFVAVGLSVRTAHRVVLRRAGRLAGEIGRCFGDGLAVRRLRLRQAARGPKRAGQSEKEDSGLEVLIWLRHYAKNTTAS